MNRWGIVLALLILAVLACDSATLTPSAATSPAPLATATLVATPGPSPTPAPTEDMRLGLSLVEFVSKYDRLTDLQRDDFLDTLPGKTVDWMGRVYDVDDRGVFIDMPGSVWNGMTMLKDVPNDEALLIVKGSRLHFTGTIDQTVRLVFFYVYVVDVKIVP